MKPTLNAGVREIGATRPRVRSSLKFSFQEFGGKRCCVIEDPLTSKFHRVGLPEYMFLSFLDGKATFAEAFARASLAGGSEALSEAEAISVLGWLVENGLADFGESTNLPGLNETAAAKSGLKWRQMLNILFLKWPLFRPDPWLEKILPAVRWSFSKAFIGAWGVVVLVGLVNVSWNWDRFAAQGEGVLASDNWVWLGLAWIILKVLHETWHGLTCKYYGGPVREAGVFLMMFLPVGYVDASSSWGFPSKWQRIHVAMAGILVELFVASIAAVVWGNTGDGVINTIAYNTILMASMVTIFFNANPLMRFDGYYVLSDLLELPNLAPRGQASVMRATKRWLLGVKMVEAPDFHDRDERIVFVYGVLSAVWRFFVMISVLTAASVLFRGGGLLLAVIAGLVWLVPMIIGVVRYLREGSGVEQIDRKVAAIRCGGGLLAMIVILFVPIRATVKAPAVVEFGGLAVLRAECPGFVEKVHVRHRSQVSKGQLLVTLSNRDEQVLLEKVSLKSRGLEVKARVTYGKQDVPGYQAEISNIDALRKQYAEKKAYVDTLEVRAPADGLAIGPDLDEMAGRYIPAGQEILRIGQLPANELKIAIEQEDVEYFRKNKDFPIWVKIAGRSGTFEAILYRVTARALRDVRYPALTSLAGGPLPVMRRKEAPENKNSQDAAYELVEPHFIGTAKMTAMGALDLNSGERAYIKFSSREGTPVWKLVYGRLSRFFDGLLHKAEQSQPA